MAADGLQSGIDALAGTGRITNESVSHCGRAGSVAAANVSAAESISAAGTADSAAMLGDLAGFEEVAAFERTSAPGLGVSDADFPRLIER